MTVGQEHRRAQSDVIGDRRHRGQGQKRLEEGGSTRLEQQSMRSAGRQTVPHPQRMEPAFLRQPRHFQHIRGGRVCPKVRKHQSETGRNLRRHAASPRYFANQSLTCDVTWRNPSP